MEIQIPSFPILFALFLFVFVLTNTLMKTAKKTTNHSSTSKLPPGPWKLPLVGNLHQLLGSLPHRALRDLAKKYGPLMYLRFGQVPTIVVSSPDFAKEVMKTLDSVFAFRPQTLVSEIILYDSTNIVFAPFGEYWRQLRKICSQELLSSARVQSLKPVREEEMFTFVEWIGSNVGSAINLTKRIHSYTYSVTSRSAFGKKSKYQEEFISMVIEASEFTSGFRITDMYPSSFGLLGLISGEKFRLEKWKQKAERILDDIINDHMATDRSDHPEEDLVDVLLKFHDNGDLGFLLTMENIKAVILDIFFAGSETSSIVVDWAMAEMIKNPKVMNKVQNEVREVFRRKGSFDETSINEMKYLKSVVKETLRLHPSAPLLLPRECSKKCEIGGYEIPEKTRVIVNAWAIGRNPKYWTEPESFKPERFIDSSIDFRGTDFEYIPFGAGRRICPGILYGIVNVELPLAMLLYHFDWKLPNEIMKPHDLDMSELFGLTVGRKYDLELIPIAYDLSPVDKFTRKIM